MPESENESFRFPLLVPGDKRDAAYEFSSSEDFHAFLDQQRNFYSLLMTPRDTAGPETHYQQHPLYRNVKNTLSSLLDANIGWFTDNHSDTPPDMVRANRVEIYETIRGWFQSTHLPSTRSVPGHTLGEIYERSGVAASCAAMGYIMGIDHARPALNKQMAPELVHMAADGVTSIKLAEAGVLQGSNAGNSYLEGFANDWERKFRELHTKAGAYANGAREQIRVAHEIITETRNQCQSFMDTTTEAISKQSKDLADEYEEAKAILNAMLSNSGSQLSEAKAKLDAFTKLSPATSFWNTRMMEAQKQAAKRWKLFWWTLGAGGIVMLALIIGLLMEYTIADWAFAVMTGKPLDEAPSADGDPIEILRRLTVVGVPATIYLFALRIFSKLALTAEHAAVDAQERVSMIRTYEALVKDNADVKDASFEAVINRLTRPVATGLIRGEAIAPFSLNFLGDKKG